MNDLRQPLQTVTYRLPVECLPRHLGVSLRTVRRWIADGRLVVEDDTVDDMEAQALRDLMATRRNNLRKSLA